MDIYLAVLGRKSENHKQRVNDILAQQAFEPFSILDHRVISGDRGNTEIFYLRNRHNPMPPSIVIAEGRVHYFSGYTADAIKDSLDIGTYFGGERWPTLSPGGIYTYLNASLEDGSICSGSSYPTTEVVYFQSTGDCLALSNNLLLAHLVATGRVEPTVRNDILLDAAPASAFINNLTSLEGVERIPACHVCEVRQGERSPYLHPVPLPEYGNHGVDTFTQRRTAFVDLLLYASQPLRRVDRIEFRLSGGKDSRALAAAVAHLGIETQPVNNNAPYEIEGQIADKIASIIKSSAVCRPELTRPTLQDFVSRTREKIRGQGGMPHPASLQYPIPVKGQNAGDAVLIGHAHVQRGGLARPNFRFVKSMIESLSARVASPLIKPEYSGANFKEVRHFIATGLRNRQIPEFLGLTGYVEWPLNEIFPPYHRYMSNWHHQIMPLMDERFCLYCLELGQHPGDASTNTSAGIVDLRNDVLMFAVTKDLCRDLTKIPLADHTRYWFERGAKSEIADLGEDFELRDPALNADLPITSRPPSMNFRRMPRPEVNFLWSEIRNSSSGPLAVEMLNETVVDYFDGKSEEAFDVFSATHIHQMLWTFYGLKTIENDAWWQDDS